MAELLTRWARVEQLLLDWLSVINHRPIFSQSNFGGLKLLLLWVSFVETGI
ncbi:MAG: hypothetical protein WAO76_15090 [Georgfuchsia sp.]